MQKIDIKSWKGLSKDLFITSALVYLALLWFEWNSPESVSSHLDYHWLLIASFLSFVFWVVKLGLITNNVGIISLATLLFLLLSETLSPFFLSENVIMKILEKLQITLWILSMIFSSLLLLKNRTIIQKEIITEKGSIKIANVYKNGLIEITKKKSWKYEIILLALIVILFAAELPLLKDFIGGDEWHMYNLAKTIDETGQLETEWNFFYDRPDFHYSQETVPSAYLAMWIKIFGENVSVAHLSSFSIAILFMIFLFLITKRLFGSQAALTLSTLVATNPFFVWQSIYIRGYIYLLLLSLLACYLLLKIGTEKDFKKNVFFFLLFLILLFLMKDIRVFSIVLLAPLILIICYRICERYHTLISQKTKRLILTALAFFGISFFLILPKMKEVLPYYGSGFKETLSLSVFPLKLGFFTFPLLSTLSIILSFALFLFINLRRESDVNLRKFSRKYFLFLVMWGLINFIYCYFSNEELLSPRYLTTIIPLNLILLIGSGYFVFLAIFKKTKKVLIGGIFLVLLANGIFWTTDNLHGWSSGYNFTDIYKRNSYTVQGRIPEKTDIMYGILKKYLSENHKKKIAILTEYFADPRMETLSQWKEQVDLIALRKIIYDTKLIENIPENYEASERNPIKREYLEKILSTYDSALIIFQTRKSYKFMEQAEYAKELGFKKISGEDIDGSGVEIFVKEK